MPDMIKLDLLGDVAPVRGDTYVHAFSFYDNTQEVPTDHPIDMSVGGATYECEFRNRNNTIAFGATVTVTGAGSETLQIEAAVPANLPLSEIGSKLWRWDIERTEPGPIITTILGGDAEIKRDATNSPVSV
jgi:hypothetical protein